MYIFFICVAQEVVDFSLQNLVSPSNNLKLAK